MQNSYIYIISNKHLTTFYVGVTSDLQKRIYEHQNKLFKSSFSSKYNLDQLLYWEISQDVMASITREKQIKNWKREWKLNLIKTKNPEMIDLSQFDSYSVTNNEGILKRVQDDGVVEVASVIQNDFSLLNKLQI
jgi:putative endonuclease